jgi:hypothetical protein
MDRHFAFEAGGKQYRQDFLPSEDALRLHHKIMKLGTIPALETLTGMLDGGAQLSDLADKLRADGDGWGKLLEGIYIFSEKVTPEDVESVVKMLSKVTWVDTGDGKAEQRLDAASGHFKDGRDMFRMYAFIGKSLKEQLRPFFADLSTVLASLPRKSD